LIIVENKEFLDVFYDILTKQRSWKMGAKSRKRGKAYVCFGFI